MPAWREGDVEANGVRIHYVRAGGAEPKPVVVLAHGFSDDALCWTPVAKALEPDYDVVMLDARGHGRSAAPSEGYGPREMADDLRAAIAALGLKQPAVLGHSMGALTALVLAGSYPDVPGAILLEDPPDRWMRPQENRGTDSEWQSRMRTWISGLQRKSRAELVAAQRVETPGWSEDELEPWAESKLRLNLNVFNRDSDAPVDMLATIRRVRCPALLITGDPEHGAIVSRDAAEALKDLIPQLRVAHIPGTGHSIRRDDFDRYIEVVRGALAERAREAAAG